MVDKLEEVVEKLRKTDDRKKGNIIRAEKVKRK